MSPRRSPTATDAAPQCDRYFFDGTQRFTRIGSGSLGGKRHRIAADRCGVSLASEHLRSGERILNDIPAPTVLVTGSSQTVFLHLWGPGEADRLGPAISSTSGSRNRVILLESLQAAAKCPE